MKNHLKISFEMGTLQMPFRVAALVVCFLCAGMESIAANKNVWIESPVNTRTNSQNMTVCIGDWVYFEARTGWTNGLTWSWSGATMYSDPMDHPSLAYKNYTSSGGPFSVTATYKGETSYAALVKVIKVASSSVSEGTEIDDGDGDANTKEYVVCKGTGDITVTATCDPGMSEAQLAGTCWGTSGGNGTALLTRTVNKSTCGTTVIWFSAGTSYRRITINVVCVDYLVPGEGTLIPGSSPETYVTCVSPGNTVYVYAGSDPSLDESKLPPCWSFSGGDPVGLGKFVRSVSAAAPSITTFTATSGTSSKTIKLIIMRTDLKSIDFISAPVTLKSNIVDWTDNGTDYATPHWVRSPARNNPFCHYKNGSIIASITVKVEPAGVNFDLAGSGPGYLTFTKNNNSSSGADQSISVTSSSPLPNSVGINSGSINWSIKASGANVGCGTWSSGPHKIYTTYDVPSGSVITEKRLDDVCTAATGQSTLDGCAGAIFNHLQGFSYDLNGPNNGPSPIWLLHAGAPYSSQCPGLADFINKHFQILGLGEGSIKYCRAMPDGTYAALDSGTGYSRLCTPGQNGHPNPTSHDDISTSEWLLHLDGGGWPNNYEATCLFNGKHYAVGVGIFTTPKQVVTTSFGAINWFYTANNNAPPNNIAGCNITPWVEAP